ncbi:MAG: DUF4825 domain-containing protein [Oscillospiraceae bacterium]|nr:DUF4825 domain-containing protein [Oscillospiraceae bacterium]
MKKKTAITLILVLLAALLLVIAAVTFLVTRVIFFNNNAPVVPAVPEDPAAQLYAQKHEYIGRLPADLSKLLGLPEGWQHIGYQLHTDREPYGFQHYIYADSQTYDSFAQQPALQKNALLYMALIGNCDYVLYTLKRSDGLPEGYGRIPLDQVGGQGMTLTYTREWTWQFLGRDIKTAAETEESFRAFYNELQEKFQ